LDVDNFAFHNDASSTNSNAISGNRIIFQGGDNSQLTDSTLSSFNKAKGNDAYSKNGEAISGH